MSESELKPCPFCGGDAEIVEAIEAGPQAYVVTCKKCLCSSRVIFALKDDVTFDLISAWNARADLANAVKVKPLVWEKDPRNVSFVDAEYVDDFGLYCIAERVLFIGHTETGIRFGTVKEAKAAAQADYERRILSAIIPGEQPATEQPDAIQKALNKAANEAIFGHVERTDRYAAGFRAGLFKMKEAALRALIDKPEGEG